MAKLYRYAAFVSYSSKDAAFAAKLHRALEHYGIPTTLGKFDLLGQGGKQNRIYPVFRDREELPAGNLTEEIEAALEASNSLIVVCSPDAARSPWVAKEIEIFVALGRRDRIFPIIAPTAPLEIEGRDATVECFPAALRGDPEAGGSFELIAADARPGRDEFRSAWLKLVAGIIGVNPGALADRDRKRLRAAAIRNAVVAIVFAIVVTAVWQTGASRRAVALKAEHARAAQFYSERSRAAKTGDRNGLALYFAARSLLESSRAGSAPVDVDVDLFTSISPGAALRFTVQIPGRVSSWALSPGRRALAVHGGGASVKIIDPDTGRVTRSLWTKGAAVSAMAFADDRRLAVGDIDGNLVVYDVVTGSELASARVAGGTVKAMTPTADANVLIVATASKLLRFDLSARRASAARDVARGTIESLAIDPSGRRIAAVSSDYSVPSWSLPGLAPAAVLRYRQAPRAIAYAAQPDRLLVSTWDRAVHLVDAASGAETARFTGPGSAIEAMDVSGDSRFLATGDRDGLAHLWDLDAAEVIDQLGTRSAPVEMVRFLRGGTRLAVLDRNGLYKVWQIERPLEIRTIHAHDGAVRGIACLPDATGARIVSVGDDGMARIWDAETGDKLGERNTGLHQISASAAAADGRLLATGGSTGMIALWALPSLEPRAEFRAHDGRIAGLAFVGDGALLASVGWDGTVGLWNSGTGAQVRRISASERELTGLAAGPEGDVVATTGLDGKQQLFTIATGQRAAAYADKRGFLRVVGFSHKGSTMVTAGQSGIIHVLRPPSRSRPAELVGQSGAIWSLSFSPDDRYLLSGSRSDGDFQSLRIWDLTEPRLVSRPSAHFGFTLAACFSRDRDHFVTGGGDGLIKRWSMNRIVQAAVIDGTPTARLRKFALKPAAGARDDLESLVEILAARSGFDVRDEKSK